VHTYFSEDLNALNGITVDCSGTSFEEQVWNALRTIPPGTTMTTEGSPRSYGARARLARLV